MALRHLLITGAVAAGIALAGPAAAREFQMANFVGPKGVIADGNDVFMKMMNEGTDGEFTFENSYGGLLLDATQMLEGVPNGVADIGYLNAPYFQGEFPEFNLIANMGLVGKDAAAMGGAIMEYVTTCDLCLAELHGNGHVYLGSHSTLAYRMQGRSGFSNAEELKGLKLRTALPSQGRWAEHFGAVRVALSGGEAFEAISTGLVDGALAALTEFYTLNLGDIATDISMTEVGVFNGTSPFSFGVPQWQELTDEHRAMFIEAATYGNATMIANAYREESRALAEAEEKGMTLHHPSPEFVKAHNAFIEQDVQTGIEESVRTTGVENAQEKVDRYLALIDKWRKLADGVDKTDADALGKLYMDEIWSKVDPATYGMGK
jgi:TRAP-type C4-dicarboxylate transport system substrate-binding protein